MPPSDVDLLGRIATGFVITFAIGFERELRGSSAGDRTFSLIGTAATAVAAATGRSSPQALAGIITGVGFIGGGLILKGRDDIVRGITTAAAVFAVAAVGLVVGLGHLGLGVTLGLLTLLILELRYLPGVRILDARRYTYKFRGDEEPPAS
jgi:putative Mg2+ transporter-C (MgtC) family protein